jgi:hypothetical protein
MRVFVPLRQFAVRPIDIAASRGGGSDFRDAVSGGAPRFQQRADASSASIRLIDPGLGRAPSWFKRQAWDRGAD